MAVKPQTKKNPGGRKTKYTAKFPERVELMSRAGMIEADMALSLGVSDSSFTEYKTKYPAFLAALKRGKKTIDDLVVSKLFERAIGYSYREIVRERIVDSGQKKRHLGKSALTLTAREWENARKVFGGCCAYCGARRKKLTKDHVVPLNVGGGLTADNVVPACGKCNSSKIDNEVEIWFTSQKFFKPERLARIQQYLSDVQLQEISDELVITKVTTKRMPADVTAAIFWLKNRRPEDWREQATGGGDSEQSPALKQVINIFNVLREQNPKALDAALEVFPAPPVNGNGVSKSPPQKKPKTRRKK